MDSQEPAGVCWKVNNYYNILYKSSLINISFLFYDGKAGVEKCLSSCQQIYNTSCSALICYSLVLQKKKIEMRLISLFSF